MLGEDRGEDRFCFKLKGNKVASNCSTPTPWHKCQIHLLVFLPFWLVPLVLITRHFPESRCFSNSQAQTIGPVVDGNTSGGSDIKIWYQTFSSQDPSWTNAEPT